MTRRITKWILWALLTSCAVNHALTQEIIVQNGDSFNKILKAHHTSNYSINQINKYANELLPLAQLAPNDTLSLTLSDQHHRLLSATIHTKKKSYVINLEQKKYTLHTLTPPKHLDIIKINDHYKTQSELTECAEQAKRFLFPNQDGEVIAAFKKGVLLSLKLITDHGVLYANLHDQAPFAFYSLSNQTVIPALMHTPTQFKRISSPFDPQRMHPISKKIIPHKGVDLAAPINTPVVAAATGKVIHKSTDTGYGNMLILEHPNGIHTYYAHLNKFHRDIQVGSTVAQFETIGYVGSTGLSTGPHLHFEVRENNIPYDPLTYSPLKPLPKPPPQSTYYF